VITERLTGIDALAQLVVDAQALADAAHALLIVGFDAGGVDASASEASERVVPSSSA